VEDALAVLESIHGPLTTTGTQPSTSGNCFKDGNPRSRGVALALGATDTTFRKPGAGAAGRVASVVCCKCCVSVPGSAIPVFKTMCLIV
jgi:hypothetical protein